MYQHEDGATFDELAESLADIIMQTIFFEADNANLFWDQYYSLKKKNMELDLKRRKMIKKYKRLRELHRRLQDRCKDLYDKCEAAGVPVVEGSNTEYTL